jgi:two-component system aerobic respiration control sensor histidine kinase ArcB
MLMQSFAEEFPKLKLAQEKNDWETICKIAHKQRGSASYCGTERFHQACTHLENYLKSGKTELREKLFDQMLEEERAVKEKVKGVLKD